MIQIAVGLLYVLAFFAGVGFFLMCVGVFFLAYCFAEQAKMRPEVDRIFGT